MRHNLSHNVEPNPVPLARGIQGLKNLGELLGWDTMPGIPHLDRDVGSRALARQRERSPCGMASTAFCTRLRRARPRVLG